MNEHTFESTNEAYDMCMCDENIKLGDLLIIPSEKVIGVADTWPVAVTASHGELHIPVDGITVLDLEDSMNEYRDKPFEFTKSFAKAMSLAEERQWPLHSVFLGDPE